MSRDHTPSKTAWIAAATSAAKEIGVDPVKVMAGVEVNRDVILARWRAWKALYDSGKYSENGIGNTSGFHHTTVMKAFKRLPWAEDAYLGRKRRSAEIAAMKFRRTSGRPVIRYAGYEPASDCQLKADERHRAIAVGQFGMG